MMVNIIFWQRTAKYVSSTGIIVFLETTFSGKRELKLLQSAKESGFRINLIFVTLRNTCFPFAEATAPLPLFYH